MQETQEYHYTCIGLFKRLGFLINYLLYLNLEIPKPFMHKNTRELLYLLQIIFKIRLITDPLSLLSPKYDKSFLLTVNNKKKAVPRLKSQSKKHRQDPGEYSQLPEHNSLRRKRASE